MVKKSGNTIGVIAKILLIIGGLNWGLAIFGINLVPIITLGIGLLANIVYALVGLSAIYGIIELTKK